MSETSPISKVLKVIYLYASQDKHLRDELDKHLSGLRRQGKIAGWHSGEITAGIEWEAEIKKHLNQSDIVLLLVSPDFVASDDCYCWEMTLALERHERGEAYLFPVLLRPTDIAGPPLALLQFLPEGSKPITGFQDRDEAFVKVVVAFRNLIAIIDEKTLSELAPAEAGQLVPAVWKMPSLRNAFFTGRATLLTQLRTTFLASHANIVVQVLSGLGGIGKTQIALEYVYRYRHTYQVVCWVTADPQGDLLADFVSIARVLRLPEQHEPNRTLIVGAIKQWFQQHEGWLLLFDNVEDVTTVRSFQPAAGKGHILITTRARATGMLAPLYEVGPMEMQEGVQFLLRRARPGRPLDQVESQEKAAAEEIVQLFAGHPLALDQAGAYVEETGKLLSDYLARYRKQQAVLLRRRGQDSTDYPASVMTTFSLSFEKVEQARSDAAELLRFCAFLHPDALPEELLLVGAQFFAPTLHELAHDPYELDDDLAVLRAYSLVKSNPTTKTVSVHRLVQEVLRQSMEEAQQRRWAEAVVRTLSREFPDGEPASWSTCQRYLSHAKEAIYWLKIWQMRFVEAPRLLDVVGYYLLKRAEYAEAQGCYEQALELLVEEEEPLLTARVLNNLGVVHIYLSHYPQATSSLSRALQIREPLLEPTHPDLAQNLNDLAGVYHHQREFAEAAPLYQQALAIQEETLGAADPATVRTLSNLALLRYNQRLYAESQVLNARVLALREKHLGAQHVDTGQSLLNLAYVYLVQQRYGEAEPLFRRALALYEEAYGPEHAQTAIALNGLARFYHAQQRYDEATPLFQQVQAAWEQAYGPVHPRYIGLLHALAEIALHREQYEEAELLLRRTWQIQEQASWLDYSDLVPTCRALVRIYERQGKDEQAASLYQLMMAMQQRFPEEYQGAMTVQEEYTAFLQRSKKASGADESSETN